LRTHASKPVPFAIYDSRDPEVKRTGGYNEKAASETGLFFRSGEKLLSYFLEREPMLAEE